MTRQPTVQEILNAPSIIADMAILWQQGLDTHEIADRLRVGGHKEATEADVWNNLELVREMSWTPEREELAKKLWLDGHAASDIAARLGGITRNAVIGKVHRLGLNGRNGSPSRTRKSHEGAIRNLKSPRAKPKRKPVSPSLANASAMPLRTLPPATTEAASALAPLSKRHPRGIEKAFEALKPTSCRFPIGDPQDSDFTFCLARAEPGETYCEGHKALCRSPLPTRKKAEERAYA